jgi:hypothetical chaperone protein
MTTLAIDFGTTNTVFAQAQGADASVLSFHDNHSIRTALGFQRTGRGEPMHDIGPWAIDMFRDEPERTRFLQSFKSFAATKSFAETQIFTRRLGFADLLETFLKKAFAHASLTTPPQRIVMGRPVTFAGERPDDALAMQRYAKAFQHLGVADVLYVHEPVAAAYFYAQRLTSPATVLVGDFGGGTSDFSLLQFSGRGDVKALGQTGIGIAGDTLDYRILEHVVTPLLGKNGTYKSWDKILPIPAHYFASFSRWNELCLMNRPSILDELRDFARNSDQAKQLEALIALIEGGESFGLYQAVNKAKAELSMQDKTDFSFSCYGLSINRTITRADFENWIAADIKRMAECAEQLLSRANLAPQQIDRIFLTGGTSFVPAIRRLFEARFGAGKVETGDELISIAKGLALIGVAPDAGRWAVQAP